MEKKLASECVAKVLSWKSNAEYDMKRDSGTTQIMKFRKDSGESYDEGHQIEVAGQLKENWVANCDEGCVLVFPRVWVNFTRTLGLILLSPISQ